jgi:hypothetical protein
LSERYEEHGGLIADSLRAVLSGEQPWISIPDLAARVGLAEEDLRRKIRQLQLRRQTVALGCCFQVRDKAVVLRDIMEPGDLAQITGVAVAMDYERLSDRAARLSKIPPTVRKASPGLSRRCLPKLAVPIWLHEQSHASRNAKTGALEEVSAQLDAYRACVESDSRMFATESHAGFTLPSCGDMMKRLAKTQPPVYGAVFKMVSNSA